MPSAERNTVAARRLRLREVETRVADALSLEDGVDPRSVHFLLRLYLETGRDDLMERAGLALAAALRDYPFAVATLEQSAWLETFVDAYALADDPRVAEAISQLTPMLRAAWASASVAESAAALDVCLRAAMLEAHRSLAQPAIDELERIVKMVYRPGSGVGVCADQISMAGALLSAYQLSGRLPYSMLAEELVAAARPLMENECDLRTACHAARVLCHLAVLHDDEHYRRTAVVAPSSDYRREAAAILDRWSDEAMRARADDAAIYGVALLELESSNPNAND
jgi:hypothetical protein